MDPYLLEIVGKLMRKYCGKLLFHFFCILSRMKIECYGLSLSNLWIFTETCCGVILMNESENGRKLSESSTLNKLPYNHTAVTYKFEKRPLYTLDFLGSIGKEFVREL